MKNLFLLVILLIASFSLRAMGPESNPNILVVSPYASKKFNGWRIFVRNYGVKCTVTLNEDTNCDFVVPYNFAKITGIEVIGGDIGDYATLQVLDTPTGSISTVPNALLSQFATTFNIAKDYHKREEGFDADLIKDLKIRVIYRTSALTKTIGINFIIQELTP